MENSEKDNIPVWKSLKISICKPLIPLKIILFMWYGSVFALVAFLFVFLKQKGMPLSVISNLYAIGNVVKLIAPTIFGVIADKTGRPKAVLVINVLLSMFLVLGLVVIPYPQLENCKTQPVELKCSQDLDHFIENQRCGVHNYSIDLTSCNINCSKNVDEFCSIDDPFCQMLKDKASLENFSLSVYVEMTYQLINKCYFNISHLSYRNKTYSWCNSEYTMYCSARCLIEPDNNCDNKNTINTLLQILNKVIFIFYIAITSCAFRFLDVTGMMLVKKHNCDFGRQRIFALLGIVILNPLVGYLVDMTTTNKEVKNYAAAFYAFVVLVCVSLPVLYKLEVQIKPPGKNMWKETLELLKNPDTISFVFLLLVLGSSFGFSKSYLSLFLEEMKPPAILLSLVAPVASLYSFPFLFCSNWWLKKFGPKNIILLSLLGYVVCGIGYFLIYNPWFFLIIEATNIVTYHLLWVTVVSYCHEISPPCLTATTIATAGGLHYGLGKALGAIVLGSVMSAHGGRAAFRAMAAICFTTALLYALYLYIRKIYLRKKLTRDVTDIPEENVKKNVIINLK